MPLLKEIDTRDAQCDCEYKFSSEAAMRAVMRNCPALEKLEMWDDWSAVDLEFIADNNKNLEFLLVRLLKRSGARFHRLKSLRADQAEDLVGFLKANPTIETLYIAHLEANCDNVETQIKALRVSIAETSLKHVTIDGREDNLKKIHRRFKRRFLNWKFNFEPSLDHNFDVLVMRKTEISGTKRQLRSFSGGPPAKRLH